MSAPRAPRLALVDALRGFAVAQMIVYHFIYDLDYFGWVDLAMNRDHPWVGWRTAIVSQFLLLVGVSLVLRTAFRPSAADFWKRWVQVRRLPPWFRREAGWCSVRASSTSESCTSSRRRC